MLTRSIRIVALVFASACSTSPDTPPAALDGGPDAADSQQDAAAVDGSVPDADATDAAIDAPTADAPDGDPSVPERDASGDGGDTGVIPRVGGLTPVAWIARYCGQPDERDHDGFVADAGNAASCPSGPPFQSLREAEEQGCGVEAFPLWEERDGDGIAQIAFASEHAVSCRGASVVTCGSASWQWNFEPGSIAAALLRGQEPECSYAASTENPIIDPLPDDLTEACVSNIDWDLGNLALADASSSSCAAQPPFSTAEEALAHGCSAEIPADQVDWGDRNDDRIVVNLVAEESTFACRVERWFDCDGQRWHLRGDYTDLLRRVDLMQIDSAQTCDYSIEVR